MKGSKRILIFVPGDSIIMSLCLKNVLDAIILKEPSEMKLSGSLSSVSGGG